MTLLEELRSGQFAIYATWYTNSYHRTALIALASMVLTSFFKLFSVIGIINWYNHLIPRILAFFVLCLEVPFFIKIFRQDSIAERALTKAQRPLFKGVTYAVFSIPSWIYVFDGSIIILLPALFLSLSAFFNMISIFKKEEPAQSYILLMFRKITGGQGLGSNV